MPTYAYVCDKCGHAFEEWRSIHEEHPSGCPTCQEPFGEVFHQHFSTYRTVGWVYGQPTTFGQQAEINAKRLGKEQLENILAKKEREPSCWERAGYDVAKPDDTIPFYRDGSVPGTTRMDKPLDLKEVRDVNHYIMSGEK